MTLNRLKLAFITIMASCATTTPGAKPHEMSTAHHEAAAGKEEQSADAHRREYQPEASVQRIRCPNAPASAAVFVDTGACWTSVVNPTDRHLRSAEEHRRHAAAHRAGASALRDAEARACAGIALADRDTSPFDHSEDISSVTPYSPLEPRGKMQVSTLRGAVVTFRAVPGMTAEWLQRVIDCHLARNASLGHVVPEMPDCPLVPNGVEARVSSTGDGFAVTLQSNDPNVAKEILARANRAQRTTTEPKP